MRRWVWLLCSLAALSGAAILRPVLQARQVAEDLVLPSENAQGLAADVAVPTLALGAFRGLVTDYLWLRSISLREQGKNFEARQVAELICRLQPRLGAVWSYLAHDLSYNLAATEDTAAGRWRWIQNGISLLRDHGLRINGDDPELYFQLSRTYQDKIGASFDQFHKEYKTRHASLMLYVLGQPSLTPEELNAASPLEALLAQDEGAQRLREQGLALRVELRSLPDFEWLLSLKADDPRRKSLETSSRGPFFAEHRGTEAYERVLRATRRDLLVKKLAIDPQRMLQIEREWGPLDWKGSDAQAVYWAVEGMRVAEERDDLRNWLRLRRIAVQALKLSMRRGRITLFDDGTIYLAPMVELVQRIDEKYLESIRVGRRRMEELRAPADGDADDGHGHDGDADDGHGHDGDADRGGDMRRLQGFLSNQDSAREDFLGEAILLLAQYDRVLAARQLLARAKASYTRNTTFAMPYDQYVIQALAIRYADPEMFDTPIGISQAVEGAWTAAFKFLAFGQDERYRGLNNLAQNVQLRWQRYVLTLPPEDQQRMSVPYEAIRQRAAFRAARPLPPTLQKRLAARLGISLETLLAPPAPVNIKPPRGS